MVSRKAPTVIARLPSRRVERSGLERPRTPHLPNTRAVRTAVRAVDDLQTTSKRIANAKTAAFHKNVHKRGSVSETLTVSSARSVHAVT